MPILNNLSKSRRIIFELFFLSCVLILAIIYGVKSWSSYFFTGLGSHWDPKIMGEWMAWNAHHILHGQFLTPNYNANFFYPHSYTLAFSELLWPESFVYALFYSLTHNPFFSFNATMLFFWTLSGILIFVLLKSLNISPLVSALGSLVYCLMPFRMPYYIEFNMGLVFIFPMMILVLMNWLKNPSWKTSLWFCFAYFISATSCLYYTIMTIIIMFFVFVAFLTNERSIWSNRKFYITGSTIFCIVFAISAIFLYPYAILHVQGGYERSATDYLKYFAQPIQYIDTGSSPLLDWIKIPRHHFAETFLFPGTALSILVIAFIVYDAFCFFKHYSSQTILCKIVALSKALLWFLFWFVVLIQAYNIKVQWLRPFNPYLYHIGFLLIFLYIAGIFIGKNLNGIPRTLLSGMAAAAVFCFFVSFGPFISIGSDVHRLVIARGPFLDLASWNPLLHAVRGLTRFSIVILTYFTIAGLFFLNQLIYKNKKAIWIIPVLAAVLIFEARHMMEYKFEDCTMLVNSKVIRKAQNLPGDYVLFQLPVAIRNYEANIVLTTIGKFPLLINGWSGFDPEYYDKLYLWEKQGWKLDKIFSWVTEVWPPAYLIIDRNTIRMHEVGWRMPFPWNKVDQTWELIDQDNKFSLYRQKQKVFTQAKIERIVRTDILKSHNLLYFKAHKTDTPPNTATVYLNHENVASNIPLSTQWKEYAIPLPRKFMGNLQGDMIEIDLALTNHPTFSWEIKDIEFRNPQQLSAKSTINK